MSTDKPYLATLEYNTNRYDSPIVRIRWQNLSEADSDLWRGEAVAAIEEEAKNLFRLTTGVSFLEPVESLHNKSSDDTGTMFGLRFHSTDPAFWFGVADFIWEYLPKPGDPQSLIWLARDSEEYTRLPKWDLPGTMERDDAEAMAEKIVEAYRLGHKRGREYGEEQMRICIREVIGAADLTALDPKET